MPRITWDDALLVEVDVIDRQHRQLIDLINQLDEALVAGQARAVMDSIFGELESYIVTHFSTEERVFEDFGALDLEAHRKEHEAFTRRIGEMRRQLRHDSQAANEVMQYLADWLVHHILGRDKRTLDLIRGRSGKNGDACLSGRGRYRGRQDFRHDADRGSASWIARRHIVSLGHPCGTAQNVNRDISFVTSRK